MYLEILPNGGATRTDRFTLNANKILRTILYQCAILQKQTDRQIDIIEIIINKLN